MKDDSESFPRLPSISSVICMDVEKIESHISLLDKIRTEATSEEYKQDVSHQILLLKQWVIQQKCGKSQILSKR